MADSSIPTSNEPSSGPRALALVKRICAVLNIKLRVDKTGSMLGGAYARLQLKSWARPKFGGSIWYAEHLSQRQDDLAFSIAHELGHFMLHRGEGEITHGPCDASQIDQRADLGALRDNAGRIGGVEEYSPRVRRELEASAFAAELLLPRAEVRRAFLASDTHDARWLADTYGVSLRLAWRRLSDALLTADQLSLDETPTQDDDTSPPASTRNPLGALDSAQLAAACADGPALVVAGPGTGKTATLVGRVAYLLAQPNIQPERIVALTFSNRAASEMRERLSEAHLQAERIPVMTIHAFATGLLREYAPHVPHAEDEPPLAADFRILDSADNYLLIEEILPTLRLRHYHTMTGRRNPIKELAEDFSQARNTLLTPAGYLALVERMRLTPETPAPSTKRGKPAQPKKPAGTFTQVEIDRARERAIAYGAWDRALRRRGLMDFGGLIMRAVELLRARPDVLQNAQERFAHLMVDEFQDTNGAAAELLFLLAGAEGKGFWVVGDHKQAIYRWRGAAPQNLARLLERYPQAQVHRLMTCYRSVPDLVAAGVTLAQQMSERATQDAASDEPNRAHQEERTLAALAPVALTPDRVAPQHASTAALYRMGGLEDADDEAARLALTVERLHAGGYAYRDQAILCRSGAQVARLAQALETLGVPVMESEAFFTRPAIKDALTFLTLAAGPDGQGLLRANAALQAMGLPTVAPREIDRLIVYFASREKPLPVALTKQKLLEEAGVSARDQSSLRQLGAYMLGIYREQDDGSMGIRLGQLLLRPGGYAWRLARIADGRAETNTRQADSRAALAALGELMRLAFRFDVRWRDEPAFRAGMIGIVNQAFSQPTSEASFITGAEPEADGIEGDIEDDIEKEEKAPMVRCFLQYIRALRLMNVTVKAPTGAEDAVSLMTLHASKGLEFPVVYLPYLTEGKFPSRHNGSRKVNPPGFRLADDPQEEAAEERCLLYVGFTRARDVAVLSWARYSTQYQKRSSLLSLLDDDLLFQQAGSLLKLEDERLIDAYRERLAAQRNPIASLDEEDGDEDDEVAPPQTGSPFAAVMDVVGVRQPLPIVQPSASQSVIHDVHALERYDDCPLSYRYSQRYHFRGGAMDGTRRYHHFVRQALYDLIDLRAEHPNGSWEDAQRQIAARWQTSGPSKHPYAADYLRHAEEVMRRQWDELLDDPLYRQGRRQIAHQQEMVVRLEGGFVRVNIDMVISEQMAGGQTQVTLARVRGGLQRTGNLEDVRPLLYALAYQQRYPDIHPRIVLHYLGASLLSADEVSLKAADGVAMAASGEAPDTALSAKAAQPATEDVTDSMRRMMKLYGNGSRSRLRKLDRAMVGIAAGKFQAKPEEQKCAACHFCFACPADPAEEEALSS